MGRHNRNGGKRRIPITAGGDLKLRSGRLREKPSDQSVQTDRAVIMPAMGNFAVLSTRLDELHQTEGIRNRLTPARLVLVNTAMFNPIFAQRIVDHGDGGLDRAVSSTNKTLAYNWGWVSKTLVDREDPETVVDFQVVGFAVRTLPARSGGKASRISAVVKDLPSGHETTALASMYNVALGNRRYDEFTGELPLWLVPLAEIDVPYATARELLGPEGSLESALPHTISLGAPKLVEEFVA